MKILEHSVILTGEEIQKFSEDCIETKIVEQSRWATFHEGVCEIEGKYYLLWWAVGSTEMQEVETSDEEEFNEVEKVAKLVEVWVKKIKNEVKTDNYDEKQIDTTELIELQKENERLTKELAANQHHVLYLKEKIKAVQHCVDGVNTKNEFLDRKKEVE
jgi:hypothetical protein